MNGTNVVQAQINLAKYPPETAKILHIDILKFFLKDEEFVSKTINDRSVDLDKFPRSKVHQLAKKMETSKATARHIKQVAGDSHLAQINLMHHQHTELSNGKYKKKKSSAKQKQVYHKNVEQTSSNQYKRSFDPRLAHKSKERYSKCGHSAHLEGFQCPIKIFSVKHATSFCHYKNLCFQKEPAKTSHLQAQKTHCASVEDWYHTGTSAWLITYLAYRLKQHENRNLYLTARLDTCVGVNIMPALVYKLVFIDPNLKKLVPSKLQIGTYTTDTVKIVGTCKLYLLHPDTNKLLETTFLCGK